MTDPTIGNNPLPLILPFIPPTPLTATVLARIGEAVDGYRSGNLVFVVVDTDESRRPLDAAVFEFPGSDFTGALAMAEAYALANGSGFVVAGPFATTPDEDAPRGGLIKPVMFLAGKQPDCKMNIVRAAVAYVDDIASVTVSLTLKPGRTAISTPLDTTFSGPVEAIFFTLAATDRFWFPYLTKLYDPRLASDEREKIVGLISAALQAAGY